MTEVSEERRIAEKYVKEMLEAYDSENFASDARVASNRHVHDISVTPDISGENESTVRKT